MCADWSTRERLAKPCCDIDAKIFTGASQSQAALLKKRARSNVAKFTPKASWTDRKKSAAERVVGVAVPVVPAVPVVWACAGRGVATPSSTAATARVHRRFTGATF